MGTEYFIVIILLMMAYNAVYTPRSSAVPVFLVLGLVMGGLVANVMSPYILLILGTSLFTTEIIIHEYRKDKNKFIPKDGSPFK